LKSKPGRVSRKPQSFLRLLRTPRRRSQSHG